MAFITPTREPSDTVYYVDANTNFLLDDRNLLVQDIEAIANQIYNILATDIEERVFEPEFGTNLKEYLFSPTDETSGWLIENEIVRSLGRWMPRIEVIRNQTFAIPYPNDRYFEVSIRYRIINTGIFDNLNFNFNQASGSIG